MKNALNNNPSPHYDYSQLVNTAKKESQYKSFSTFIDEKIHEVRNRSFDGDASRFNRYTLAEILGMDVSTLTKIINGSQATRKRDVIIGACFALQLTESEANLALNLYPMAPLNPYNLRDLVIIHALRDGLSVSQLNDVLSNHHMPKLNLLRGDKKSEDRSFYYPFNSTAYEEVSIDIRPYCIDGDSSNASLHERYHPDRFDYESKMIVQSKTTPSMKYRITLDSGGDYDIFLLTDNGEEHLYSDNYLHRRYLHTQECDDAGLLNEITKLKEYTDRKARYVYQACGDTRNFRTRLNATNDHGQLVVYGETFGCDAPELCEYFQIEVSPNSHVFTVSDTSRFMERYLGEDAWMKLYGVPLSHPTQKYTSLDEIDNNRWRKQFTNLLDSARDLLVQLQQRELFLFNAREWIEIDQLMHMFKVEEEFDCYQPDDEPYDAVPRKNQILGPDGKQITVDDLYRAAELDIGTIDELCSIRTRYGSLEGFLMNDMLTMKEKA